jgi:hypothetical protein
MDELPLTSKERDEHSHSANRPALTGEPDAEAQEEPVGQRHCIDGTIALVGAHDAPGFARPGA